MRDPVVVEICVDSPQSAVAAARGGADRLELCGSLLDGGTTPSAGAIATVRNLVSIDLYVMIRPRGGDFFYSSDEFAAMKRDIAIAKQLRADGVVFGILTEDGKIDMARCRELIECARPLRVTLHRAFDMSCDLEQSLEDAVALQFDRILTSGGEQKVEDAIPAVSRLRELAADRVALMICGGIRSGNVQALLAKTGAREVHSSARRIEPSSMRYRNEGVSMGLMPGWEYQRAVADESEVRNLVQAASAERVNLAGKQ